MVEERYMMTFTTWNQPCAQEIQEWLQSKGGGRREEEEGGGGRRGGGEEGRREGGRRWEVGGDQCFCFVGFH